MDLMTALIAMGLFAIYFIPAFIALAREHDKKIAIVWLNVLTGWSLVGWIAAFIWACLSTKPTAAPSTIPMRQSRCPSCYRPTIPGLPRCGHCGISLRTIQPV